MLYKSRKRNQKIDLSCEANYSGGRWEGYPLIQYLMWVLVCLGIGQSHIFTTTIHHDIHHIHHHEEKKQQQQASFLYNNIFSPFNPSGWWGRWKRRVYCERWLYPLWFYREAGVLCNWHGSSKTGMCVMLLSVEHYNITTFEIMKKLLSSSINCMIKRINKLCNITETWGWNSFLLWDKSILTEFPKISRLFERLTNKLPI